MTTKINATLNDIFQTTPIGPLSTSVANALYGINHRMTPGPVPVNRDYHGLILFTRPQLNLTDQNVRALRPLLPLLTTQDVSIQRMVRKLLDPRLENLIGLKCPLMDNRNAFIPILTNHAVTASGFPDMRNNSYVSKPGARKEVVGQVDDIIDINDTFDVNVSFRNMVGDPISLLMEVWLRYASAVFTGEMIPYPDFIVANEYDYNTRIWRLVLDKNKKYVTKIGATGYSYPRNLPIGATMDFAADRPMNSNSDTLNFQFQSFGMTYNDPILYHEFNKVVGIFNPAMREDTNTGKPVGMNSSLVQVDYNELQWFNNDGYLRIDPFTRELEVWMDISEYNRQIAARDRTFTTLSGPR